MRARNYSQMFIMSRIVDAFINGLKKAVLYEEVERALKVFTFLTKTAKVLKNTRALKVCPITFGTCKDCLYLPGKGKRVQIYIHLQILDAIVKLFRWSDAAVY